ncbi:sulfite exporter TauE/SafE family protein [uncultured Legionella sp.]|uniref:sulfite exporter TauE/SafE family protein n=1 Tax=uncultured Legionella sp. TaxID=210934 RepID=UPI0026394DBB|nr:sulfite exporter TauE/SafE family protein [uncultured Legionella sp.]
MLPDLLMSGIIYVFIGAFAGLMSGAIGIGGGIVIVPGLVFVFQLNHVIPEQLSMHVAAATSLAVIIFTSLVSVRVHYKIGEILWPVFNRLWPGLALGVVSGVVIADAVPTSWLKIMFGLFLLFVAVKMLTNLRANNIKKTPGFWLNGIISYFIGVLSGLLGVGGGVLIVPYLTYCGVAARKIVGVSNLCTFVVGFIGTIVFMLTGQNDMANIAYSTGYVYWPAVFFVGLPSTLMAPIGARLHYLLPVHYLTYGFIVLLILTAIKMLS